MDYEAVIIGSGAGGGTTAHTLAKSGKNVLIIEKGQMLGDPEIIQNEKKMLIDRIAYDNRKIRLNGRDNSWLYNSGISGGGTSLYGAVMLRPSPQDFQPGQFYPDYLPDYLHEWPVSYNELEPFYEKAEEMFRVSGDSATNLPNIGNRKIPYPGCSPDLEPINQTIKRRLLEMDLTPFHLPLAINFETCLRCPTCPGYGCPNDSRASSLNKCIKPAIKDFGTEFLTDVEAIKFEKGKGNRIKSLFCKRKGTGRTEKVTAELFVLSAGAIGSPVILQRSGLGNRSDQLGRNYMYHAGAFCAGFFFKPTGTADKYLKQLGWTDYYFGSPDFPHKLGYSQMLPIPGPLTIRKESRIPVTAGIAEFLYKRHFALAATVEDLPNPDNRIELREDSVNITHQFSEYDIFRAKYLKKDLSRVMRKCGASFVAGFTSDRDQTHTAHQVGTCRFGNDLKTSVLDKNCRLHEADNLFVIDGSFMPTSLGVAPALTIIANALRVSDYLIREGF